MSICRKKSPINIFAAVLHNIIIIIYNSEPSHFSAAGFHGQLNPRNVSGKNFSPFYLLYFVARRSPNTHTHEHTSICCHFFGRAENSRSREKSCELTLKISRLIYKIVRQILIPNLLSSTRSHGNKFHS